MSPPYTDPGYFDRLYEGDPDPWKFATSDYERAKYAATLGALPNPHYGRVFEVGCSIGVLTRQLAQRCDNLIAADLAEAAIDQARTRCADQPWVQLRRMNVPQDWPRGTFDLILFSEVLYYLGLDGITNAATHTLSCLAPNAHIVLVNWHGPTDGACTGDQAAEAFIAATPTLKPLTQSRAEHYRIDVLTT